jgi:hypothetical protein
MLRTIRKQTKLLKETATEQRRDERRPRTRPLYEFGGQSIKNCNGQESGQCKQAKVSRMTKGPAGSGCRLHQSCAPAPARQFPPLGALKLHFCRLPCERTSRNILPDANDCVGFCACRHPFSSYITPSVKLSYTSTLALWAGNSNGTVAMLRRLRGSACGKKLSHCRDSVTARATREFRDNKDAEKAALMRL